MPGKIDIYTNDWCDMVFEGRNKEYGAYDDRQRSSKRHALALIIAVSVFTVGVSAPVLIKALTPEKKVKHVEVTSLADIKIDKPIENKVEAPPPPPPMKTTVKFTPPEVTNEEVTEEVKTVDELKDTKAQISVADVKGSDDANAVDVADLKVVEEKEEPLQFVEQMPEFPGGVDAMMKYLNANIRYPSIATEMGISGRVILQFVVDKHGKINNVKVLRGIGGGCDEEAIRVVKNMPSWKPGRQNGKEVPVYFTLPVVFTLKE
ncbi:MAG TPA: TonB family protein [Bacteroidales bacterium]